MLFGMYRRPYRGQVAFNTGAQLQLPAQPPKALCDLGDLLGGILTAPSGPFRVVQHPALVCQGIDPCLDRIILHGELGRCFNAVLHQIGKLLLVAVKPDQFLPQ